MQELREQVPLSISKNQDEYISVRVKGGLDVFASEYRIEATWRSGGHTLSDTDTL
jgi:hypothetical protein